MAKHATAAATSIRSGPCRDRAAAMKPRNPLKKNAKLRAACPIGARGWALSRPPLFECPSCRRKTEGTKPLPDPEVAGHSTAQSRYRGMASRPTVLFPNVRLLPSCMQLRGTAILIEDLKLRRGQ